MIVIIGGKAFNPAQVTRVVDHGPRSITIRVHTADGLYSDLIGEQHTLRSVVEALNTYD